MLLLSPGIIERMVVLFGRLVAQQMSHGNNGAKWIRLLLDTNEGKRNSLSNLGVEAAATEEEQNNANDDGEG